MSEIEIKTREDLPRSKGQDKPITIAVRVAINRNLWVAWCLALSTEYGQPVEGFDSTKAYIEGPNPFRLDPSSLRYLAPGPYPISGTTSFSEELEWSQTNGYSLWALTPGINADIEFEIRKGTKRG